MLPRADEDRQLVAEMMGCARLRRPAPGAGRHIEASCPAISTRSSPQSGKTATSQDPTPTCGCSRCPRKKRSPGLPRMGFADTAAHLSRLMRTSAAARAIGAWRPPARRCLDQSDAAIARGSPRTLPNPDATFERMLQRRGQHRPARILPGAAARVSELRSHASPVWLPPARGRPTTWHSTRSCSTN